MNKQIKTCAVVVTYNRKDLLLECLEALKNQSWPLNAIYIIDNASTDGTPEILMDKWYITSLPPENLDYTWIENSKISNLDINYVRMCKNTGGAGGFYEGIKRAYKAGYDWLWIMDDDAEPLNDSLKNLSYYFNEKKISALASTVKDDNNRIQMYHRGYLNLNFNYRSFFLILQKPLLEEQYKLDKVQIEISSFVGLLIKKEAIKEIGFPKKEFFINQDDTEYSIRLNEIGKILLITDSIIIHKEILNKNKIKKSFLGMEVFRFNYNDFWIYYYMVRNSVWLGKECSSTKLNYFLWIIKTFPIQLIQILFFDNKKIKRTHLLISAYLDGINNKFNNETPKKILYN